MKVVEFESAHIVAAMGSASVGRGVSHPAGRRGRAAAQSNRWSSIRPIGSCWPIQPPEMLVQFAATAPRWWASLEPESPRYVALAETIAEVSPAKCGIAGRSIVKPGKCRDREGRRLPDRRHAEAPRWSFGAGQLGRFCRRKLTDAEQPRRRLPERGEAWELRLMRPQAEPSRFALREVPARRTPRR